MEASQGQFIGKMLDAKPKPEGRPGNIALDVERPLFDKGPNWDFDGYRKHILSKE